MEEKKEVTIQEIQSKLLEILLYFQKFCQENGLGFVLAGGTCLGAVRHKGFIPWDDDVDVFMLRDDYEKLCRIWDEKADTEHYSCVRSNDRFNIRHSATEIKDNNTTFINRHSVDLDIHQGLMIDVIPLDAVPKSKWKQLWQMVDSMMYCCFNFQRLPAHKGKVTYYAEKLARGEYGNHIEDKVEKVDREHLRRELSEKIMVAMIRELAGKSPHSTSSNITVYEAMAADAVSYADALLEELEKKK